MGKYSGTISFMKGVDRFVVKPSVGFSYRFAVLTWFEYEDGWVDPWPLMRKAVPLIMLAVNADTVIGEYWRRKCKGIFRRHTELKLREIDWNDLMTLSDDELAETEEEFPVRINFIREGNIVLAEESKMWSLVGGPWPYHDSVTLSFFSRNDISITFEHIFVKVAKSVDATVRI